MTFVIFIVEIFSEITSLNHTRIGIVNLHASRYRIRCSHNAACAILRKPTVAKISSRYTQSTHPQAQRTRVLSTSMALSITILTIIRLHPVTAGRLTTGNQETHAQATDQA